MAIPVNSLGMDILLGTEAEGTFSHFAGRAVSRLLNRHAAGLNCKVLPSADGMHNLTNLQGGSLDMALADDSTIYNAINKKGYFQYLDIRYDNLGALTPLYANAFFLVARGDSGIDTLADLKGKRINTGASRSRTRQVVELILDAKNWTVADFAMAEALSTSLSQDTMAFCHGSIQAMVLIGVHPNSAAGKLIDLCRAVPVSMADSDIVNLVDRHPGYSRIDIPAQTYPSVDRPVATFGSIVSLIASRSLDEETVQAIMSALDDYGQVVRNAHPAMAGFDVGRQDYQDIGISLHPGAAAYLADR